MTRQHHVRVELFHQHIESGVTKYAWRPQLDPDDPDASAVYARDPIEIDPGRGEQQGEPTTGKTALTFKGHDHNPKNPVSPLYGLIGPATPMRVILGDAPVLTDTFSRTTVDGWTGAGALAWVHVGGTVPGDYDVNGDAGTHTHPSANQIHASHVDTGSPDHVVRGVFDLSADDITGGPAVVTIRGRVTDGSNYYALNVEYSTGEQVTISLVRRVLGVGAVLDTYATQINLLGLAGADLIGELVVEGNRLYGKVWRRFGGVNEPLLYQVEAEDDNLTTGNLAGFGSLRAAGNTNANLQARLYEFAAMPGTIRSVVEAYWAAGRNKGGDRWVKAEGGGVLHREDRGEAPSLSPWRRTITSAVTIDQLLAYWPCEDERDSTSVASALPGGAPMTVDGNAEFAASGDEFTSNLSAFGFGRAVNPGTNPLPSLGNGPQGGRFTGRVPAGTSSPVEWTVQFVSRTNALQAGEDIVIASWTTPGGTYVRWEYYQKSSGLGFELLAYDSGGGVASLASTVEDEVILTEHRIDALQNGPNTYVRLWVGGNLVDDNNYVDVTNTYVDSVTFNPANNAVSGVTGFWVGHVRVWNTANAPSLGYANPANLTQVLDADGVAIYPWLGWLNERVADRLDRHCREHGISLRLHGDRADTSRMGPQPAETFVGLLAEAERTDGGFTYETRHEPSLTYRTRVSLYEPNQTPVTLDAAAGGEVDDPLDPKLDDLGTRNDVTAQRRDGSSHRVVQVTGPRNIQPAGQDPQGVGRRDATVDVNPVRDGDLVGIAQLALAIGTLDKTRYPAVTVDFDALHADGKVALARSAARLRPGDRLDVANLDFEDASQLLFGYTETVGPFDQRSITFSAAPADVYDVGVYDAPDHKYDSAYSTLAAQFVAGTNTSLSLAVEAGRLLWITGSGAPQFPIDLDVGGARVRVTAISGASSPQTATVNATVVNGVNKIIPAGTPVRLWRPRRYAR